MREQIIPGTFRTRSRASNVSLLDRFGQPVFLRMRVGGSGKGFSPVDTLDYIDVLHEGYALLSAFHY